MSRDVLLCSVLENDLVFICIVISGNSTDVTAVLIMGDHDLSSLIACMKYLLFEVTCVCTSCLQWFNAVGWAAGRASGL